MSLGVCVCILWVHVDAAASAGLRQQGLNFTDSVDSREGGGRGGRGGDGAAGVEEGMWRWSSSSDVEALSFRCNSC